MRSIFRICCLTIVPVALAAMVGCSGSSRGGLDKACARGLERAYENLNRAKAQGLSGKVEWGKAATLLAAAKVQEQFEKYPNCIDKVKRAKFYLRRARRG